VITPGHPAAVQPSRSTQRQRRPNLPNTAPCRLRLRLELSRRRPAGQFLRRARPRTAANRSLTSR
jgi:hypothetical protein